jgi:hypothetical protein
MKRLLILLCALILPLMFLTPAPAQAITDSHCHSWSRAPWPDAVACMWVTAIHAEDNSGWWVTAIRVFTDGSGTNYCDDDGFENFPALDTFSVKIFNGNDVVKYSNLSPDIQQINNCHWTWNWNNAADPCDCYKIGTNTFHVEYNYKAYVNLGQNGQATLVDHFSY